MLTDEDLPFSFFFNIQGYCVKIRKRGREFVQEFMRGPLCFVPN